jgi:hypothetical protein
VNTLQYIALAAFALLGAADAWLSIKNIAKGYIESGVLSQAIIGKRPKPAAVWAFALGTVAPIIAVTYYAWKDPSLVTAGWGLIALNIFFRVKVVLNNYKLYRARRQSA